MSYNHVGQPIQLFTHQLNLFSHTSATIIIRMIIRMIIIRMIIRNMSFVYHYTQCVDHKH